MSLKLAARIGGSVGPLSRLGMALASIFAPKYLAIMFIKSFLETVEELDTDELEELVARIRNA